MDKQELSYEEMKAIRRITQEKNVERAQAYSKKQLIDNLSKKFRTSMIGGLAKFEENFGYLWGHGKQRAELTKAELEWREKWEITRTEILNNGNNQLRGALDELSQYTTSWDKYKVDFIIQKDEKE